MKNQKKQLSKPKQGGGRFKVPSHPPSFTSGPWFNLIVRIDSPGAIITTLGLRDQISNQLGSGTVSNYTVRLQRVRFWGNLTGAAAPSGSPAPINVLIHDPIAISAASGAGGIGQRVLEQITAYPDVVNRSAFGYRYPEAQRNSAIELTGTSAGQLFVSNGMGVGSVVYVDIQWRFAPTAPPL
jgi:hypothetical protein